MKNKKSNNSTDKINTYKSVEDALEAKHDAAKKFIAKVGIDKIAALGK